MASRDIFIHSQAIVESAEIGAGTRVWAFSNVQKGAVIGADCNICDHCFIESNVQIGNEVTIKNGVSLWDGVTIEDRVFIGPNAVFTNDIYPRSKVRKESFDQTVIREGASIGANATIVAGNSIGRFAMIGAGAVVTHDIPDYTVWYGNPARQAGYVCVCTEQLALMSDGSKNEATCGCGLAYRLADGKVIPLK